MSLNLGTITYGDLSVLPSYNVLSGGYGDFKVAGTTLLAGASTNIQGVLGVNGAANLSSSLTVAGVSTFNSSTIFNSASNFTGAIQISNSTDSTNPSTGALQISGGLGVALSTNLGGVLNVTGATSLNSTLSVTGSSNLAAVRILDTTASNAYTQGALTIAGGLGVAGNICSGLGSLYLAGNLVLQSSASTGSCYLNSPANDLFINNAGTHNVYVNTNSSANFNVAGEINVNAAGLQVLNTNDSTASTNGSLIVSGGVGIGLTLNVGGNINSAIAKTLTIGNAVFTNTTQSSSVSTGCLQTAGGIGISKNAYIGGCLDVASVTGVYSSIGNIRLVSALSGSNFIQSGDVGRTTGNWTPLKYSPLGGTNSIMTINGTYVSIDTGQGAVSTTTGALVVTGGTGISGDIYVGATANITGISNFNNNIWINDNNIYLGINGDQTSGLVYSSTTGGPFLYGANAGALGTSSGTTVSALTWDSTQSVQIKGSSETNSTTSGALTVAGGIGIAKSANIGTTLHVQGGSWTSTVGTDAYLNAGGSNINIRNTAGSISGELESNLTDFNLRTINQTSPTAIPPYVAFRVSKISGHTHAQQTDDSTGNMTGSLQTFGGASISKSLWVGLNATVIGNLSVTGSINAAGAITYANTTNSTSTTTGAVVISGGLGVGENAYIGGTVAITSTSASTSVSSGALIAAGGFGLGGDLNVAGNGTFGGNMIFGGTLTVSGSVQFNNTIPSTSTSTGALTLAGGVGILGNIFAAGTGNFTSTTSSNSISTGSIVTAGGLGVAGGIYVGGMVNIVNTNGSTSPSTGSLVTLGGVGIGQNLNVSGNSAINGTLSVGGTVVFYNTIDSTAATGGSLVVTGGVGIGKSLYVGSPVNSTSPSSGAIVITGGAGIGENLFIGGNATLSGPLFTFNNNGLSPPSFNSRSIGTRLLLFAVGGANASDYAIGVSNNSAWYSIPTSGTSNTFSWYGGTTLAMSLDGSGTLTTQGTSDATSSTTGALQVLGGAGISKSLYVGSLLNVGGTSFFNSTITASSNINAGGILTITNPTDSTSPSTGSVNTAGGLGVTLSMNVGANFSVAGNANIGGNLTTIGIINSANVQDSTSISSGSAVFSGGVGVAKNLNVGGSVSINGSTTINGNLYVNGTRTEVSSNVLDIQDNIVLVNSGPSGSSNSGIAMKRYQLANDNGEGDVVNDGLPEISGTVQAGATTTTITFGNEASTTENYYNGAWIKITGGTGSGQVRRINTYLGSTRTATIYSTADQANLQPSPVEGMDWDTIPDTTSTYSIFTGQYILTMYDEINQEYGVGSSPINPVGVPQAFIRNRIRVHAGSMLLNTSLSVDSINNYTSGAGTTISGVNLNNGAVTGVASLNGGTVDVSGYIYLIDNNNAANAIVPGSQTFGSYIVLVSDVNNTGSSASFFISGNISSGGSVLRASSTPGSNNENLTISWTQGDYPRIKFMQLPSNQTGVNYTYRVKLISC